MNMGLDNLPAKLPCITQKTAIYVDGDPEGVVDCAETTEACGCPFNDAKDRPETGAVHGIFGSPCWYRGKYGNALIEEYGSYDEIIGVSFYGTSDEGTYKDPDECRMLATYLDELVPEAKEEHQADLVYAAWWLEWVAEHGDGSYCWY